MRNIDIIDILIRQSLMTYEGWLFTLFKTYPPDKQEINISEIHLRLPENWPKGTESAGTPEWAARGYSYEQLNKQFDISALIALHSIGFNKVEEFSKEVAQKNIMSLFLVESIRLHLMTAAAHAAFHGEGIVKEKNIREAGEWRCWAWPWC
jgi:hypothetical protein